MLFGFDYSFLQHSCCVKQRRHVGVCRKSALYDCVVEEVEIEENSYRLLKSELAQRSSHLRGHFGAFVSISWSPGPVQYAIGFSFLPSPRAHNVARTHADVDTQEVIATDDGRPVGRDAR